MEPTPFAGANRSRFEGLRRNRTLSAVGRSPVVVEMTLPPRRARVVRTKSGTRAGVEGNLDGDDGLAAARHRGGAGGGGDRDQGGRDRLAPHLRQGGAHRPGRGGRDEL